MRKIFLSILIFLIILPLTSCYDANEIDDLTNVLTIGIDRGVSDKWRFTIQFPTLKEDSESNAGSKTQGSGSQNGYTSITIDAPSFFTGINMINSSLSRRLNFMHTENLIISEDLAKSGELGEILSPLIRFRQIRRSLHVFVTRGSAMEFVNAAKPAIGTTLSKNMQNLMKEADSTGFFPHVTLNEFYDSLKSTYHEPIAVLAAVNNSQNFNEGGPKWKEGFKTDGAYYAGTLPRTGLNKIEFFGTAVFHGDKMIAELNGEETRLMQIARGDFNTGFFTIEDPNNTSFAVALDIRQSKKPEVNINIENGVPIIHLKAALDGDILAIQSGINYESLELKPVLEAAFEKKINDGLNKLMKKSKELKTDIFGFGKVAARQFPTIQEWENYNWIKQFQSSKITTEVKFTIKRTGTQLKTSPIKSMKGYE